MRLKLAAPTVRIGLSGDGKIILLQSAGGLHVVDPESGRDLWKHVHRGPLRVVLERSDAPEPPSIFRVQVASLTSREEAEALAERLRAETGELADVAHFPDRNAWRVRVGQRASREEIARVEDVLRALGFGETWVVEEAPDGGPQPTMRLVDDVYNDMPLAVRRLLVLPASAGRPIQVGETSYRGVVEIRLTRRRALQAINELNLEEYLRGVVPKELGPTVYPELEALKAQAVAARTYTIANRGQFTQDGYDICDTARCQVYGGQSAEHAVSDFAVAQTAGLIATYEGRPINALYTSTCGGHTEDLANVFREMKGPYLKGVECYPEREALAASRRTLKGAFDGRPIVLPGGERIDGAVALLEVFGVIQAGENDATFLSALLTPHDAGGWTRRALRAAGKRPAGGVVLERPIADLADLAVYLVDALGWAERLERLIDPRDIPSLLDDMALAATPEPSRRALAYMLREDILPRLRGDAQAAAAGGPRRPVTRGMLARALHRLLARYEAIPLTAAKYRGFEGDTMTLQASGSLSFRPLAPRLHLLLAMEGERVPVARHALQYGDNLEYHLDEAGRVDMLVFKPNQRGAADDRYSNYHVWETRISRADLEERIRSRASVGRLVDVLPGKRGVSGRLLDLTVVGSSGRAVFRGFDIERLLGLRESLFVVDRQYGTDGRVEAFVFSGKGWGHGVGLCQVGAYGMALRGKSFEEILRHYYTGIAIEKAAAR